MSQKYKVVALIGAAGSGKDTIMKKILKEHPEWNEIISCTSRPPREGEKHGVNYYFYKDEEFIELVNSGQMLESTNFNNWFYGTPLEALKKDTINIGVFNPAGIKSLRQNKNIDLMVFYIKVDDKERLLRQLNREKHPDVNEIIRRFYTDQKDFAELPFFYWNLNNNTKDDLKRAIEVIPEMATFGQN